MISQQIIMRKKKFYEMMIIMDWDRNELQKP